MKSCGKCKHLHKEIEGWETPHIWWWECAARPGVANLTSFPFINTKCQSYAPILLQPKMLDAQGAVEAPPR